MLIRNAELDGGARADVRIEGGRIIDVCAALLQRSDEVVVDAQGAALLPGLHDHHLHLYATAAARLSVNCGPPLVTNADALCKALRRHATSGICEDWIRGTAYHESVAGALDRTALDEWVRDRPVRIQHRSGRLWIFNSAAIERLDVRERDPLERINGSLTGRLYDGDAWLRERIGGVLPSLHALSRELARCGVTGVTDASHGNDPAQFETFRCAQAYGELLQHGRVMGAASLDSLSGTASGLQRGATKFHLHDHALPDFEALCASVRRSHAAGREVAFHCVTRGELVFALAALGEVGSNGHDRIEHGGVVPPELLDTMSQLHVSVVTQPHFIFDRGDAYLRDVERGEHANLYRLRSLLDADIPLAAGSDAPYGSIDPWTAMQAAVDRGTRDGAAIAPAESLTPEQALALYLAPLENPAGLVRRIEVGAVADICLLREPWQQARVHLRDVRPRLTMIAGNIAWEAGITDLL